MGNALNVDIETPKAQLPTGAEAFQDGQFAMRVGAFDVSNNTMGADVVGFPQLCHASIVTGFT